MWAANFFVAASLTMILPFLSLYIQTFGSFSDDYVQKWSGLTFGVTFIAAFIFSPIWGRIGDRYGRKKVLIFLGYGVSVSVLLMGFVNSVYLLFVLRLFMGLFAGFVSTAQALISAQTDKKIAGKVLGTLQTGNVSGALFGPLIGGVLADSVGFMYTFLLTSVITGIAATLVLIGIREFKLSDPDENKQSFTSKQVITHIFTSPMLFMIMIISTIVQAGNLAISPLLALYVHEMNGAANLALLSGIAFSSTGLGNLIFTRQWGKLGDRIGYERVLILVLILSALVYLPQAFVTNIWYLVIFRFLLGVVIGGVIPCRVAYIRGAVPLSIQGEVLGYNTSFRFLGNTLGPILGGFLAAYLSISSVFYVTSFLFLISAALLWICYKRELRIGKEGKTFIQRREREA